MCQYVSAYSPIFTLHSIGDPRSDGETAQFVRHALLRDRGTEAGVAVAPSVRDADPADRGLRGVRRGAIRHHLTAHPVCASRGRDRGNGERLSAADHGVVRPELQYRGVHRG